MRAALHPGSVTLATILAFAACATHEEPSNGPERQDPPNPILEAGTADASDASDAGVDASRPRCSKDGFCFEPVPSPRPLRAVSASSVDDAWMVPTDGGQILRWDGTAIKQVYNYSGNNPSSITFLGIWAQKKDDVWAVAKAADGNFFFVRYASPPGGGAPVFRELRTEVPVVFENEDSRASLWGTPGGGALWITTHMTVLRVQEAASGAVVEDVTPAIGAEGAADGYRWLGVWGFAEDDVYVGGGESLTLASPRAAVAHLSGARWSISTIDSKERVLSLHGTPPGTDRQLWTFVSEPASYTTRAGTQLIPIVGGALGTPIVSHESGVAPVCGSRLGQATAPGLGWFSEGVFVCRWTDTKIEPLTAAPGAPVIDVINDVWAGGTDDVWIVGAVFARPGIPQGAFAARRTAATAKDGRR